MVTSASSALARAHGRSLGRVALTRGAEDGDHPAAGQRAQDAQHLAERIGGVRVIDHHAEGLPKVHRLHPARHAGNVSQGASRQVEVDALHLGQRHHRQRVVDVEATRQLQVHSAAPVGGA